MIQLADQLQPSRLKTLPRRLYATTKTECFTQAAFAHVNAHLLAQLGIDKRAFAGADNLSLFTGTHMHSQLQSIATVYAGHQFGVYTSKLGDGRVHILGELLTGDSTPWEVQLKGAGATPFARGNSGRLSLAEAITEYLGCEAMAGLGIASTRGLALIPHSRDSETVQVAEAILVRMAPSHLRFGHFEYLHNQHDLPLLQALADHVIELHYPELLALDQSIRYLQFLYAVTQRTARLLAQWQAVGFVHSVMNTDNMSILGLTLDYGVYGFMQAYDPAYSPNANDDQDRYAFDQQVEVARWNCLALAEALVELLPDKRIPAALLRHYRQAYTDAWQTLMRSKLGLCTTHPDDGRLISNLLELLRQNGVDYTRFFRRFAYVAQHGEEVMVDVVPDWHAAFQPWFDDYRQRLALETTPPPQREASMLAHNPKYILRPSLVAHVIRCAEQAQDFAPLQALLNVVQSPYTEHQACEDLA
jgi:uncharacterized protein YdiU (UPF0061 family)